MTGAPTRTVDAVLLDVGGVFLLPDPDKLAPVLHAAGAHPTREQVFRAHYAGTAAMDATRGPDWPAYRESLCRSLGVTAAAHAETVEALEELFEGGASIWTAVVPGTVDALRALAATGYALGIVSNADGTIEAMLLDAAICQVGEGAGVPVTVVVDSTVVGISKPDPAIFTAALEELGVAPHRAVHIGDTAYADVEGAHAAGIHPLHLDPYGDCPYPPGHHDHVRSLAEVPAAIAALVGAPGPRARP